MLTRSFSQAYLGKMAIRAVLQLLGLCVLFYRSPCIPMLPSRVKRRKERTISSLSNRSSLVRSFFSLKCFRPEQGITLRPSLCIRYASEVVSLHTYSLEVASLHPCHFEAVIPCNWPFPFILIASRARPYIRVTSRLRYLALGRFPTRGTPPRPCPCIRFTSRLRYLALGRFPAR
jgi:hypothetical protein